MNIIDLRNFSYEIDKIISFKNNEIIFSNVEYKNEIYKRYFYKYNIENKSIHKINAIGIITTECACYTNYFLNNFLYTNTYIEKDTDNIETLLYKVNLIDGKTELFYSIKKEVQVTFLSDRYILLKGSNYEPDNTNFDIQKDIRGEYDFAFLYDIEENTEYEIKDKRVILGIRDYFLPYNFDGIEYIVFEESYMEDWELEELFDDGLKKEDFYMNSYTESINVISLDKLINSIKNSFSSIPFNQISKTELNGWTRYFGMDDENIYYRTKDFKNKIQNIFSINKKTLNANIIKSIKMENIKFSYSKNNIYYDLENKKIYSMKIIDNNIKEIKELLNEDFIFEYKEIRETFQAFIDSNIITSFWTEDDTGDNCQYFVKIRNKKNLTETIYEGSCIVIKNNVVLFK